MDVYQEYRNKCCTANQAVQVVKDGDWVDYGMSCAYPTALDKALARRQGELKDIKVRNAISCHAVLFWKPTRKMRPLRIISGIVPALTESISMLAGPTMSRCYFATAAPIISGALRQSM